MMLTLFLAKASKIVAAVPGAPTIAPPLTSIRAVFRIAIIDFTIFCEDLLGSFEIIVPWFDILNAFLILIGILLSITGSKALGCIYLAPNSDNSIASANDTSLRTFACFTICGSAVIRPLHLSITRPRRHQC